MISFKYFPPSGEYPVAPQSVDAAKDLAGGGAIGYRLGVGIGLMLPLMGEK